MDGDVVTASFAVVLPGEPMPVRLMNTIWADRSGVHDALVTVQDLEAWLAATHLQGLTTGADLNRLRALRDALRRLAALVTGDTRAGAASATTDVDQAVAEVNEIAALAPSWPQLVLRGSQLQRTVTGPATLDDRLLATIAREAIDLFTVERGPEIRACQAPGCILYFVQDHPRREWCSTACGNRARVARHYDRHHRKAPTAGR